jgi:general secretion pathway protein G
MIDNRQSPIPLRALQRGFTLLEVLVVLVIIGMLAGLVGPRLLSQVDRGKVTTAEAQIKMLRSALETMRLDLGRFPTTEEGLSFLTTAPVDPAVRSRWVGPYLDGQLPMDPWGNPYQYSVPGRDGQPFALYSYGGEGKPSGGVVSAGIGYLPPTAR